MRKRSARRPLPRLSPPCSKTGAMCDTFGHFSCDAARGTRCACSRGQCASHHRPIAPTERCKGWQDYVPKDALHCQSIVN
eukprot:1958379-Pleurochrysis_carterae.AAC.1